MTLVGDPETESLGSWVEQLVAESTGKEGKGIVPIDLEPLGPPDVYGDDRVFIYTSFGPERADRKGTGEALAALERAGHPVIRLKMAKRSDLGREFFRWELATAIAGSVLRVNPFDEPDVTEAKLATSAILALHQQQGALPDPGEVLTLADADAIRGHVSAVAPGHYVALCAYFRRTPERDRFLARARVLIRQKARTVTTLGYGPRYLHSTGQLHKGGPATGVFVQLTADVKADLPIPSEGGDVATASSFGILRDAQALGDLQVLRRKNRRVVRVHLGSDVEGGLERLLAVLGS
jgi:hypothetical protein